jgi:hypothetical protein
LRAGEEGTLRAARDGECGLWMQAGGRTVQQELPLLDVDDGEPHAVKGRAVPEGLTDVVGADGRERADAERPVRPNSICLFRPTADQTASSQ